MLSSRETTGRRGRRRVSDPQAFVLRSLAARAQSVAEIEAKLAARGVEADAAARAVDDAVRLGFLDDAELAGQVARGLRARGYGRRRAAQTLRRRGLSAPVAHAALEEAFGEADEVALAVQALGSRTFGPGGTDGGAPGPRALDPRPLGLHALGDDRARRRAVAFLVRRGFSRAAAWRAVRPAEPP